MRSRNRRRGVAMMLVISFTAIAAVMAYALLAGSLAQEQIAYSQPAAAEADALAESGANLALYYLQNPSHAPTLNPASGSVPMYWPGANNISFTNMPGTTSVTVTPTNSSGTQWSISSTGTWSFGNSTTVAKTVTSTTTSTNEFVVKQAIASNTAINIGSHGTVTITNAGGPAIVSNAGLTVGSSATVTGAATASSYSGFTGTKLAGVTSNPVPSFAQVYNYGSGYTYNGTNFIASLLNLLLSLLLPGGSNPANVTYYNGNVTLSSATSITGTLYVAGNLTIASNVSITPAISGFPALVVSGTTNLTGSPTLTVNGLAYFGTGLTNTTSTSAKIVINGGMLIDQGGIPASYKGGLNVTYNANNVNMNPSGSSVPAFTSATQFYSPVALKMSTWSN